MNAAFREMNGESFDSVIFHDVDILPSEELMPYYATPPVKGDPAISGTVALEIWRMPLSGVRSPFILRTSFGQWLCQ